MERLCRNYGTRLHLLPGAAAEGGVQEGEEPGGKGEAVAAGAGGKPAPPLELFAFPTLEQLAAASEEALRADGYGYRWVGRGRSAGGREEAGAARSGGGQGRGQV